MNTNAIANTLSGIYRLLLIAFVLFVLYFAQSIMVPLTIAALLTFLLSPLVTMLEKWVGRIASILLSVLVVSSLIGLTGYIFTKQLIVFGSNFQTYAEMIQTKFEALQLNGEGILNNINYALEKIGIRLGAPGENSSGLAISTEVKLVDLSSHVSFLIEKVVSSVFSLLTVSGIILLLVIFMLFHREDLRTRIIKLMGQDRISYATGAVKDAGERVANYLSRLFIVNAVFGLFVFVGLSLIGIPNPILWGGLAALLRFIPYIGPWIAAIIPIILSAIISDSWLTPVLTTAFFVILELVTAYAVEPLYYGEGTGISSFALILAAIFWTWMWGPIGLLLSTPLTVCLVVIGQYVTNMHFLEVLLSQEKALTPVEECYHHLLMDSTDSTEVIEKYLSKGSLITLYDEVLLPVIYQAEKDYKLEQIDAEKKESIYQSLDEAIEFLGSNEQKEERISEKSLGKVLCIPSRTVRDELGALMLSQILSGDGLEALSTHKVDLNDIYTLIEKEKPQIISVVVTAPPVFSHARFLAAKLNKRSPQTPIVLCLLGSPELDDASLEKLTAAGVAKVIYTLPQASKVIPELV